MAWRRLLVAGGLLVLAGRTEDRLVELTLTTIAAYGSFMLAEHLDVGRAGVAGRGDAGGNFGMSQFDLGGRPDADQGFWEYAAFLANRP